MSDQCIIFSPERNQWTLADGRHHMEVPEWAREIMRGEFERETRPLRDNLDLALDSKRIAERRVTELLAENAKLRELVRGLHMAYIGIIDQCESFDSSLTWEFSGDVDADLAKQHASYEQDRHRFDVAMRELGVEVDG